MDDSIIALLSELNNLGIQLHYENEKLKVRGPKENITPELTGEIRENKQKLISLLSQQNKNTKDFNEIPVRTSNDNLPLSYLQRKLWLIDQLEGTSIHYNMPNVFKLEGQLNRDALLKALSKIVERHESLRTVFRVGSEGKPIQIVKNEFELELPIVDYSDLPEEERAAAIHQEYSADLYQPFDLGKDLMFRAKLIVFDTQNHALLLDTHHISSDGWSLDVLFRELCVLYSAYYHSKENPLPELPIQYPDYALWMASWLEGEAREQQLQFWDKHLQGLPAVHSIPLDKPRPKIQTPNGKRYATDIDYTKYEKIKQFCEQHNVTMFMFMQSVYAALLSHWSGDCDVIMGTPIANRARPELALLIGFFTNTVVLRTQCNDDDSFLDFLQSSKKVLLESYENQHIPFDMLVDYLNPVRSLAHNALAQITFALENKKEIAQTEINLPSLTIKPSSEKEIPTTVPSKFDLEFVVWESSKGFTFQWTYNKDLFNDETIHKFNQRYERLLDNILRTPERPIHELLKPDAEELDEITVWNQSQVDFPGNGSLLDMLESQLSKTPEQPAIIFKGEPTSFGQLHERSNQLAHYLMAECDVKPGQLVGLCYERSVDMLVAVLAILKSGAGYIPLDPNLPVSRLGHILEDSQPTLVMVHNLFHHLLENHSVSIISNAEEKASGYPITAPSISLLPESTVYAMYTSGSTGKPKGAINSHQAICNKLHTIDQQFPLSETDRVLQKTPISFDVSVVEIFWPLTTGACIVLAEPEVHKDPVSLADLIETYQVTVTHFVPSMLQTFLRVTKPSQLNSLKLMMLGGEALSYELLEQTKKAVPSTQLINHYGPTEAGVDVSWWLCELREDRKVPIGKPSANVRLYILDQHQNVMPKGIAGELYIAGVQVGSGYINQPALTSERFFDKEILGRKERIYRTGDRARWLEDGNIEYLGRLDEQVQLRGVRIELGEIESSLVGFTSIDNAAVIVRDDDGRPDKDLVAYIVLSPSHQASFEEVELREQLKHQFPEYMLPQTFVYLEALPLTSSGKLDKRSLPIPNYDNSVAEIILPQGETEQRLERIFAELLQVSQVCVSANFFEQGGNSLLATELRIHIQQVFSKDLPLKTIFEYPVVRELAKCLDDSESDATIATIPVVPKNQWQLSFAQQRFWFAAQFDGKSTANICNRLHIQGPLDISSLRQAFIDIVDRHSILRQTFPTVESKPTLQVLPTYDPLTIEDLQTLPDTEKQQKAQSLTKTHASYPFDIANEALFRVVLLKLEEEKFLLVLTVHHIISDGQSLSRIIDELSRLYRGYSRNEPTTISPLPLQYGDFATWQRKCLADNVFEQQRKYWLDKLAGIPQLHGLPTDFPRPPQTSYKGSTLTLPLASQLQEQLRAYSHEHDCTLFMTMLATYKLLLSRYSGEQDICIGTPIDNRGHHQLKELTGLFVNTIVLRSNIENGNTFDELVRGVRESALEAYSNQDYPFEQLVEEISPDRSLSYNALFQITFQLDTESQSSMQIDDLEMRFAPESDDIARFDLSLFVHDGLSGLECYWSYSTELFHESTIARMHKHFESLLKSAMAYHDSKPAAELLQVDESDQKQLALWQQTEVPFPKQDTIVSMFDRQVAVSPEQTAIIYSGQEISYSELQQKANRLANALIEERKVTPRQLIGVCMERSVDMVVSLLAILKTGAGYIAFDPELPSQRLDYICQDSGVDTVLVHAQTSHQLQAHKIQAFDVNSQRLSNYSHDFSMTFAHEDNLAYVIYTSGSTGKPKGAMNKHSGICNKLHALQHRFNLTDEDRVLQKTPINFDASVGEIFWPLTAGATLVLIEQENTKDPSYIGNLIKQQQITVIDFVPSMLKLFLQVVQTTELSSLRLITIGGEALSYELQTRMIEAFPKVEMVNRYGPSEAAIEVSYWPLDNVRQDKKVPIGTPTSNVRLYVLDQQQNVMPIGIAGELCIAGIQVGPGYLGHAELTEQKYVECQVLGRTERLYRTGDKARWMTDGELEFLGRLDDQIKLRGFRIELGEIESCLQVMPEINNVAVVLQQGYQQGSETLVAYCVPEKDEDYISIVKSRLKVLLPEYMIPQHFVTLSSLPMTPSGKLDRRALPALDDSRQEQEIVELVTEHQKMLSTLYSSLLGLNINSASANFFNEGGHSLLATELRMAIQQRLSIDVPLQVIFERPVIAELAQWLDSRVKDKKLADITLTPPKEWVLSYAQQRFWFIDQYQQTSNYNIFTQVRLDGTLDIQALRQSFCHLVQRHSAFKQVFPNISGVPSVELLPDYDPFTLHSLEDLSEQEADVELASLVKQYAQYNFDITREALFKVGLVKLGANHHQLIMVIHHIISDGHSMTLLIDELIRSYGAYQADQSPQLTELPVHYGDYAKWQRNYLTEMRLSEQRDYWLQQLEGSQELLRLPTDFPRPKLMSYQGSHVRFSIPADVRDELKKIAKEHDSTLFMTCLAAFKLLLSYYSGEQDICVGTPVDNRNHHQLKNVLGLFVNTLVLRTQIDRSVSFDSLLNDVKQTAINAYAYQEYPFEKLVEELNPQRSLSHSPLFQVMFQLDNQAAPRAQAKGLDLSFVQPKDEVAKFDLTLNMVDNEQGIECVWGFATDLFKSDTIVRMHDQLVTILQAVTGEQRDKCLYDLSPLAERDKQLVARWNATETAFPESDSLVRMMEQAYQNTPENTALIFAGSSITYRELHQRANYLAAVLVNSNSAGASPLVGLCAERSIDMVVGLLAILKAGFGYVPLDPDLPQDRLTYMIKDSGVRCVLMGDKVSVNLDNISINTMDIAQNSQGKLEHTPKVKLVPADSIAYAIYTSGTTGTPKGALVSHQAICNKLRAVQEQYGLGVEDTLLHKTPISFDVSVLEIFWPLSNGGRLVLAEPGDHKEPEQLAQLIEQCQVTIVDFVPSMLQLFLQSVDSHRLSTIRLLTVGGEALTPELQKQCIELLPNATKFNHYGPTEAAVDVTSWNFDALRDDGKVLIGCPGPNVRIYILDEHRNMVHVGLPGELYIAGRQVGIGYLNRDELTAERFIDWTQNGHQERLYRTGDCARWLDDGNIEFLGRIDEQVQIKGYRIELGEIESVLSQLDQVKEAAVVLTVDAVGDAALLAAVVVKNETGETTREEIFEQLEQSLPAYMLPSSLMLIESLPKLVSGKIDKQALKRLDVGATQKGRSYVAPTNEVESQLCRIFADVTGQEQVGIRCNFFSIGGDSLKAVRVIALSKQAGLNLSVKDIFEHQNVEKLASFLFNTHQSSAELKPDVTILGSALDYIDALPDGFIDAFPLTATQQLMANYHDSELAIEGVYLSQSLQHFRDEGFNVSAFEQALTYLLQKHASLRTVFAKGNQGEIIQLVREKALLDLQRIDLRRYNADEQIAQMQSQMHHQAKQTFKLADLSQPLSRYLLFDRGENDYSLLMVSHHGIEDGWSFNLFVEQLLESYQQIKRGQSLSPINDTTLHFKQRVAAELQARHQTDLQEYWRNYLAIVGSTKNRLPKSDSAAVNTRSQTLMGQEVIALEQYAQRLSIPLKALLLAVYFDAIKQTNKINTPVIDTVVNGRTSQMANALEGIGQYWSFKPVALTKYSSPADLAQQMAEILISHEAHVLYPFESDSLGQDVQYLADAAFNFVHFQSLKNESESKFKAMEEGNFHQPLLLASGLSGDKQQLKLILKGQERYFDKSEVEVLLDEVVRRLKTIAMQEKHS